MSKTPMHPLALTMKAIQIAEHRRIPPEEAVALLDPEEIRASVKHYGTDQIFEATPALKMAPTHFNALMEQVGQLVKRHGISIDEAIAMLDPDEVIATLEHYGIPIDEIDPPRPIGGNSDMTPWQQVVRRARERSVRKY